jgi:hypothetical protein
MLDFSLYKVEKKIPKDLLAILREESSNLTDYSSSGYPGSSSLKANLEKRLNKRSAGPQLSKLASVQSKLALEKLIGVKSEKCSILLCEPHFIVTPHADAASNAHRKSCLTWVLFPEDPIQCAPTLFYDENDQVIATYMYDEYGFILDTRLKHGMINNHHTRILVQLTFEYEPSYLMSIIK